MGRNLTVRTSVVYDYLLKSGKRITVMQGGARSGKTYNILLFFVIKLLNETGKVLTVCRDSLPSIKGSVLRDFLDILLKMEIYSEDNHNKTENTYVLNGNLIEFVSVDQPHKIRGRRRNYLFLNEANELNYDSWMQLVFRTEEKIVLDYNPSDEYHWIYEQVVPRDDCDFYITTYLDNPFISKELIDEIERLELADVNYWRVYGLGQRGISQDTIYTHWQMCKEMPGKGEVFYGQDFGYNVESALVKVEFYEGAMYWEEMLYQTRLTTNDLIDEYRILGIHRSDEIYADSAEPKTIEEIARAGYNIQEADKEVLEGIRMIKSMPLYITERSTNIMKEIKNYKWKVDRDGKRLDEPVKFRDHAMDAGRYGVFTKLTQPQMSWVAM